MPQTPFQTTKINESEVLSLSQIFREMEIEKKTSWTAKVEKHFPHTSF